MVERTNPKINSKDRWYRDEPESNHHLMPSSRADDVKKQAQIMLFESFHTSRHRVFWNGTPIEQIYKVLSLNWPVLKDNFRHAMEDMMRNENYIYRNWLWTKKK